MRRYLCVLLLLSACLGKQSKSTEPQTRPDVKDKPVVEDKSTQINVSLLFVQDGKTGTDNQRVIPFEIPEGTGEKSWNDASQRLVLFEGQILRIRNNDSIPHTLHTGGRPCDHGSEIKPGESFDCALSSLYDARTDGPLYDHNFPSAQFWFTVLPRPDKVLASNCLSCHSQARKTGGLDLESWPPVSSSSQLANAVAQRVAPNAADSFRMPPSGPALARTDSESLTAWAEAGFFELKTAPALNERVRSIRWNLLQDGKVLQTGSLTGKEKDLVFTVDKTLLYQLRFEELVGKEWELLAEFELVMDHDNALSIPANPAAKRMKDGYYGIDDIYAYAARSGIRSVAELLKILPTELHNNFVLMKDSKSRHLSNVQYPRGILFSKGARLLIGFSSHPDDPLRETLEMAEALDNGTWKFREITFRDRKAELSTNDTACVACHTENPRPIWGSYPKWPGAFGDDSGKVAPEEFEILKQLSTNPMTKDRFESINFEFSSFIPAFYLPVRSYGYGNTVFNAELGRRASYALSRRIKQKPNYKAQYAAWLLHDECQTTDTYGPISMMDMDLSAKNGETPRADGSWNGSANSMSALVGYWSLMDLMQDNAVITDIFKPLVAGFNDYARLRDSAGLELSTDALENAPGLIDFRPHQFEYPRVLGNSLGEAEDTYTGPSLTTRRKEFCAELRKIADGDIRPRPTPTNINVSLQFVEDGNTGTDTKKIIEFAIPKGTGEKSWNDRSKRLVLFEGQTLRIRNDDSIPHTMHTNGRPCEHGSEMKPGESFDCVLTSLYDARIDGPLYDHNFPSAQFWFTVLPSPDKVLASNCLSCHSKARKTGGLDLESWPPVSSSSQLAKEIMQRLSPDAADGIRMPPSAPALAKADGESLTAWAEAGFFDLQTAPAPEDRTRNIRWSLLQGDIVRQKGNLTGKEKDLIFAADNLSSYKLRFEEMIGNEWRLLVEFELMLDRDRTLSIPAKPAAKPMKDGYYGIDDIYAYAAQNRVQSVAELLEVLPTDFHNNFVLMKDSKSRHLSSPEYPRGILFSDSARILLGFSSHPNDPLRETLEMAEAMDNGTWKFREISFRNRKPEMSQDDKACRSCHTENPRPIWGSYPKWPGAYGDSGGSVTREEFTILKQLASNPVTRDRFASINMQLSEGDLSVTLPARKYNYGNTVFNIELGRTASRVLAQRIKQQPQHKQVYAAWLLRYECQIIGTSEPLTLADMDLAVRNDELATATPYWNESSNFLHHLIGFWALMDLKQDNAVLADIFAPIAGSLHAYAELRTAAGLELSEDHLPSYPGFRPNEYEYPRVLGDRDGAKEDTLAGPSLSTRRKEFCAELQKISQP